LDKVFVNEFWAASGWETKDEWLGGGGIERFDALYTFTQHIIMVEIEKEVSRTNDII
jgi:hypothetical protein